MVEFWYGSNFQSRSRSSFIFHFKYLSEVRSSSSFRPRVIFDFLPDFTPDSASDFAFSRAPGLTSYAVPDVAPDRVPGVVTGSIRDFDSGGALDSSTCCRVGLFSI
jgi:hypothetical protein